MSALNEVLSVVKSRCTSQVQSWDYCVPIHSRHRRGSWRVGWLVNGQSRTYRVPCVYFIEMRYVPCHMRPTHIPLDPNTQCHLPHTERGRNQALSPNTPPCRSSRTLLPEPPRVRHYLCPPERAILKRHRVRRYMELE